MQNVPVRHTLEALLLFIGAIVVYAPWRANDKLDPDGLQNGRFAYISDSTFWNRTQSERQLAADFPFDLAHNLDDLPRAVGDWTGTETTTTDINALIMLEPEQFIQRLYRRPDGRAIWLTLIGSRQSRSFHPPTACYDADGWQTDSTAVSIPLTHGAINGVLIKAVKPTTTDQPPTEQRSFYFYLFPNSRRDPADGIVMVRLTSPPYGSVEETETVYSAFLSLLFSGESTDDAPPAFQPIEPAFVAAELHLEGYQLSHNRVPSGGVMGIDLAWRAATAPTANYQAQLAVIGPEGNIWSQNEMQRPQIYDPPPPTTLWPPEQLVWDNFEVTLLPGTPPGQYAIGLRLYEKETLRPLAFQTEGGPKLGPQVRIGQINVTSAETTAVFQPQRPINQPLPSTNLTLLGADQDRAAARPGDPIWLTFYWEKADDANQPDTLDLQLRNQQGVVAQRWTLPAVRADYPPANWSPGERLRGQHSIRLAAALDAGAYQFLLNGIPLGALTVEPLDRLFVEPIYETAVAAIFSDQIALVGYTIETLETIALVWQTAVAIPINYHVFVHYVNQSGEIVAQSDGEPAGWTRPFAGWLPGEFVIDRHTVALPEGVAADSLAIHVGLYNPDTGERLQVNGKEFLTLGSGE